MGPRAGIRRALLWLELSLTTLFLRDAPSGGAELSDVGRLVPQAYSEEGASGLPLGPVFGVLAGGDCFGTAAARRS